MTQDIKDLLSNFEQDCQRVKDEKQSTITLIEYVDKLCSAIVSLNNQSLSTYDKYVDQLYQATETLNMLLKEETIRLASSNTSFDAPTKETFDLNVDYSFYQSCKQSIHLVLESAKSQMDLFRISKYTDLFTDYSKKQVAIDKRLTQLKNNDDCNQPDIK